MKNFGVILLNVPVKQYNHLNTLYVKRNNKRENELKLWRHATIDKDIKMVDMHELVRSMMHN